MGNDKLIVKEAKFEVLMDKVGEIVKDMQEGGLSLEDMLSKYENGVLYLTEAGERLKTARAKLEKVDLSDIGAG